MGVTQILYMYVTNLIIMTFNIIIIKHDMLKINHMKACKHKWKLEIVTKTKRAHLYVSKPRWSSHQTPLESDASKIVTIKLGMHPPKVWRPIRRVRRRHCDVHTTAMVSLRMYAKHQHNTIQGSECENMWCYTFQHKIVQVLSHHK